MKKPYAAHDYGDDYDVYIRLSIKICSAQLVLPILSQQQILLQGRFKLYLFCFLPANRKFGMCIVAGVGNGATQLHLI